PQPNSVPINLLIPVKGTPLENSPSVDPIELVKIVAITRILIPKTRIRLSAGRTSLSREAQIFAFFSGANSIFIGEKLLTRPNPDLSEDEQLLKTLQANPLHNDLGLPGGNLKSKDDSLTTAFA